MTSQVIVSILLVLFTSTVLIVTGLKKQPGLGIIGAVVVIGLAVWLRGDSLTAYGFGSPPNWGTTVLLGLLLGLGLQLLSVMIIEPLSEKVTGTTHDHSVLDNVKGNWKAFLQWMLVVWIFAALLEEGIYRGFLMTEIAGLIGLGTASLWLSVIFTSVVFGLSHGYQRRCGMLSTGIVGALLAAIFIWSGFNLWLAIFTHGFIDTIGIGLMAIGADKRLQQLVWKDGRNRPASL